MQPDGDDVFVVTFPKSGTHMMAQLVLQALTDGAHAEFESIHEYVTALEVIDPDALEKATWRVVMPGGSRTCRD